jgi:hypothetical protein
MKIIHLSAYCNPAPNLRMIEVSEPNGVSLNPPLLSVIGGEGAGTVAI